MSVYFTMGRPFPSKLPLLNLEMLTPSNTWLLGSTRVLNPNGISIGSAIVAGLTVTYRPTDRPHYSVGNNRQHLGYLRSTSMKSNNSTVTVSDGGRKLYELCKSNQIYLPTQNMKEKKQTKNQK